MDSIAIGFWGGYFGIAVVAFFAGAIPWAQGLESRSARRHAGVHRVGDRLHHRRAGDALL